jgi:hypothetical protein
MKHVPFYFSVAVEEYKKWPTFKQDINKFLKNNNLHKLVKECR